MHFLVWCLANCEKNCTAALSLKLAVEIWLCLTLTSALQVRIAEQYFLRVPKSRHEVSVEPPAASTARISSRDLFCKMLPLRFAHFIPFMILISQGVEFIFQQFIWTQEAMESFAFPAKINSISTEILRKCSKLYFFSLESLEYSFLCFGLVLKEKCINQKAKPHKPSSVVGLQNGIWVLGLSCFVSEEFDNNDTPI